MKTGKNLSWVAHRGEVCCPRLPCCNAGGPQETRLLRNKFGDGQYLVTSRPVANDSDTVMVTFGVSLLQIRDVVSLHSCHSSRLCHRCARKRFSFILFYTSFIFYSASPEFGTLAFRNGLEIRIADERINIAMNNWPTSWKNLVKFGPITPYIISCGLFVYLCEKNWKNPAYSTKYLECILDWSSPIFLVLVVSTWVSSTTFARGRHCND